MKDIRAQRSRSLTYAQEMTIPGWLSEFDARILIALLLEQTERGTGGDLLEVGTYMGRSAALLGLLAMPGEQMVVIDTFDATIGNEEERFENQRAYSDLTQDRFVANYRRVVGDAPMTIRGRSDQEMSTLPDGSFRLIHIDGSHEYDAVVGDIHHARRLGCENAIIVMDDVLSGHTPGVTAATYGSVVRGELIPLIQTNKLYASLPGGEFDTLAAKSAIQSDPMLHIAASHAVAGHPVLELRMEERRDPLRRRIARQLAPPVLNRAVHVYASRRDRLSKERSEGI